MMNEGEIRESLKEVLVPGIVRSIERLNLIREVIISNQSVKVVLASTALSHRAQEWVSAKTREAIATRAGVDRVEVEFIEAKPAELNKVEHIVAVMSGKGGVGKSLVASLAAVALRRQGYDVGILDADITGPSIPKMFGVTARPAGSLSGILPVPSKTGIEIMSINLLLPGEGEAVIWRGPLIARAITQFWEDVLWGKLDYLIVDLPPGTADASLTVMQSLPITGVIIVFTPQNLTMMIVKKAIDMAHKMDKPVLGVVENMSHLYVPEIDKKIEMFGPSRGQEMAEAADAPLISQLPLDPLLARLCDQGDIERYDSEIVETLGRSITQAIASRALEKR